MSHSIRPLHGLAECYVFVKQSHGPFHCAPRHCPGGPLLPKLRGYFAEFLNEVSPARLGILVPSHRVGFGTGCMRVMRVFSGKHGRMWSECKHSSARRSPAVPGIAIDPAHCPSPNPRPGPCMCRNVDLLSIDYALRPRLRSRLTPGGRTCPGKPWDSGDQNFHLVFRYSCPHNRSCEVHRRSPVRLPPVARRSPTTGLGPVREFGCTFDSRSFSARGLSSSQLLRTV